MSNPPTPPSPTVPPAIVPEMVARFRFWFLILGVLLVLLGLFAASHPFLFTEIVVEVFGGLLIVSGLLQAGLSVWTRHGSGFVLDVLAGVLGALIGLMIVAKPHGAAAALTLLLAIYFLLSGACRLVSALFAAGPAPRLWLALVGLVDVVLGVMILNRWPSDSTWLLGLFVGINLLFSGLMWVVTALSLRVPPLPQSPAGGP